MATETKTQLEQELDTILRGAAVAPLTGPSARGFLRITGPDATRWLNGMVTNNIKDLAPGQGNENFMLNAQGRILGTCTIYREPGDEPTFLLETDASQLETIQQTLDRFIIMDDVELAHDAHRNVLAIIGDRASQLLALSDIATDPLEIGEYTHVRWHGLAFDLVRSGDLNYQQYEIWTTSTETSLVEESLIAAGATHLSPQALEAYRIFSGKPRYGVDIRNTDTAKDLPQETGQFHALHFNKGCYLGQEIVERIHSRGQVHRQFTAFTLTGPLPATLSQPLEANGKPAGEITSAIAIGNTLYALGYVRREALDTQAQLTYPGGIATPRKP